MLGEKAMFGSQGRQGRRIALAASFSLLVAVTLGIAHELEHEVAHLAEDCAVCATVRAPLVTAPASAPLAPVLLCSAVALIPCSENAPLVAYSVRTSRGPPLA
jgi:hypothetical protein